MKLTIKGSHQSSPKNLNNSVKEIKLNDNTLRIARGLFHPEITKFVAEVYYSQAEYQFSLNFQEVLNMMLEEDKLFADYTTTYTLLNSMGEIVATVRTIIKPAHLLLPIEREYAVSLEELISGYESVGDIYEIARFATKMNGTRGILILFRELIRHAGLSDLVLASLDSKVLKGLRKIGFYWFDLCEPKHYLGSLTCPVAMRLDQNVGGIFTDLIHEMKLIQSNSHTDLIS